MLFFGGVVVSLGVAAYQLLRVVVYSGIIQLYISTVYAFFKVKAGDISMLKMITSKVISYRLFLKSQIIGNCFNASGWKTVFELTKFFESYYHDVKILVNNKLKSDRNKYRLF